MFLGLLALAAVLHAPRVEDDAPPSILPLRERAALTNRWLEIRLDTVVPELLRREGVDTWVLIGREYNEDPVLRTMLPAEWLSARRRTILVFHDGGEDEGVERFAVSRYDVGAFPGLWDPAEQPDPWKRLASFLAERQPRRIVVDVSEDFALADGLSSSEHQAFLRSLTPELRRAVGTDQDLAIGWLETRIPEEMELYPTLCRIAHRIIAEGFSDETVEVGVTTTEDLEWWYRERILDLRLATWFHPSVSLQRPEAGATGSFASRAGAQTIRRGDLLHVDFGITYLDLNTDTQQHAYVLREGEQDAPAGLKAALAVGNRLQDVLTGAFRAGRSGNEILRLALERAEAQGIDATIYTHPLGYHGHGAGPTIGLWDQQGGVPGRGDYPLHARTVHSIELNAAVAVPEWDGQTIRVMLEEDAYFDGETVRYLDGRQTELILIP